MVEHVCSYVDGRSYNATSQELPIRCNETTAIREFGTAKNCLQNMAVSLAAS
jgi:hypothetical protein